MKICFLRRSHVHVSLCLTGLLTIFINFGCSGEAPSQEASALRRQFPDQAAEVLETDEAFVVTGAGFARSASEATEVAGRWSRVEAELPRLAKLPIVFRAPGGFEARVRELGVEGEGTLAEHAVAYRRAGGTSFWTAVPGGVEEWLHLEAGVVRPGEAVAAWEVEGATLRQQGDAVLVVDEAGVARLRVTAPRAYGAGGRAVEARLAAQGATIELVVDAGGEAVLVDPAWMPAASMVTARYYHTATLLQSGKVLLAGGSNDEAPWTLASAELYDPTTNAFTPAGSMITARYHHTATLLQSGKVLVAGGSVDGTSVTTSAELYDPATNAFTPAGPMHAMRRAHTATLLQSGKVLVAGGYDYNVSTSAELYDPATNAFTPAGAMSSPSSYDTATLLQSGKVLVAAELYDSVTNAFAPVGSMGTRRWSDTATLLQSGKVLIAGGYNGSSVLVSAELYDPETNAFTPVGSTNVARYLHTATLLQSGEVLVTGGFDNNAADRSEAFASAELYDPATNTFSSTSPMSTARYLHTATLLQSGEVLVAGGFNNALGGALSSAELYRTGLSAGAACSASTDCAGGFCVDGVCCNTACGGGDPGDCQACSTAAGAPSDGTCQPASAGTACGAAEGTCGVPGICNGASTTCVPDAAADMLASAQLFVDNLTDLPFVMDSPDTNLWGPSGDIDWVSFTGVTQGASLFTLSLQRSDAALTDVVVKSYWGTKRPSSVDYYNQIVAQNHFVRVTNIAGVKPGDLLALDYMNAPRSGHAAIVEGCPTPIEDPPNPVVASTTQYELHIIDSTSVAHGCHTDTRWVPTDPTRPCAGGTTDGGAGRGVMRLYATSDGLPGAGTIVGYAWSLATGTIYYPDDVRASAIGRFVR
jgi:hypothetical protein